MNHVVEAALIGVAGSVLIAIVSFLTTRSVLLRQLSDAHKARVWDKQAATYEDVIAGIRYQRRQRMRQVTSNFRTDAPELGDPPVNWSELQGRLFAYASPAVLVAAEESATAGLAASTHYEQWQELREQAGNLRAGGQPVRPEQMAGFNEARDGVIRAVNDANAKDDALIEAIRVDLHGEQGRALHLLVSPAPATAQPGEG